MQLLTSPDAPLGAEPCADIRCEMNCHPSTLQACNLGSSGLQSNKTLTCCERHADFYLLQAVSSSEEPMWKAALAGTAALAIVGSSLVYAQQRGRPGGVQPRPLSIE